MWWWSDAEKSFAQLFVLCAEREETTKSFLLNKRWRWSCTIVEPRLIIGWLGAVRGWWIRWDSRCTSSHCTCLDARATLLNRSFRFVTLFDLNGHPFERTVFLPLQLNMLNTSVGILIIIRRGKGRRRRRRRWRRTMHCVCVPPIVVEWTKVWTGWIRKLSIGMILQRRGWWVMIVLIVQRTARRGGSRAIGTIVPIGSKTRPIELLLLKFDIVVHRKSVVRRM